MYVNVYFYRTTGSAELIIDKIFEKAPELEKEDKATLSGGITKKWTMPARNWAAVPGQSMILFADRLTS